MLTCVIRSHIDPTKTAQSERFLLREGRTFLKLVSVPHAERSRP